MDNQLRTNEGHFSRRALERFFGFDRHRLEPTPEEAADIAVGQIIREIDEKREKRFKLTLDA